LRQVPAEMVEGSALSQPELENDAVPAGNLVEGIGQHGMLRLEPVQQLLEPRQRDLPAQFRSQSVLHGRSPSTAGCHAVAQDRLTPVRSPVIVAVTSDG